MKYVPVPGVLVTRDTPTMPLDYLFAYGKTHSCSFIFTPAMESLEWGENPFEVLLLETDTVILDNDLTS